jgi:hypothetical protein
VPAIAGQTTADGPHWLHEIKSDGFRILAWRDVRDVRLCTRNGNDFADRFSLRPKAAPMRRDLDRGQMGHASPDDPETAGPATVVAWRDRRGVGDV